MFSPFSLLPLFISCSPIYNKMAITNLITQQQLFFRHKQLILPKLLLAAEERPERGHRPLVWNILLKSTLFYWFKSNTVSDCSVGYPLTQWFQPVGRAPRGRETITWGHVAVSRTNYWSRLMIEKELRTAISLMIPRFVLKNKFSRLIKCLCCSSINYISFFVLLLHFLK